jgi:hypothetical protein
MKYNYTMPFENPRYCYKLKPLILSGEIVGVALDGCAWMMPHWIVWKLQLGLAHKVAITAIFALGLLYSTMSSNVRIRHG